MMSSVRWQYVGCTTLVVCLLVVLTTSAPDMFTALVDMQRALTDERSAALLLKQYVISERQRLHHLERLADEWDEHSREALDNVENHVFHPVNYFLMAKRFTVDWQETMEQYFAKQTTEQFLDSLASSISNYPSYENYVMSASALLRLQDTYDLETTFIASGLAGSTAATSSSMSADDCFQLGKVAYNNEDFYHAIKWFDQALSMDDIETNKTTARHVVLDYLSFSVFKQGNLRHAYNLTLDWLELEPMNERAMHNLEHYRQMIEQEETEMQKSRQVIDYNPKLKNERVLDGVRASPEFDAYERLCRGEPLPRELSEADRAELVCRYRRHRPIFYIRPVKEETVNLDPKVVILHDVITDSEIAKIKELATPRLHRSGVFSLRGTNNPSAGYTSYRTSKSAWLMDCLDPLIARVSRRAGGFSNLTTESAEDLQVLNYGIGGHYEPHYDFARKDELTSFDEYQGNRVATAVFYLNDIDAGGYTVFNLLGISQPAVKGSCLLWYNLMLNGEGDFRTRHAGCPVLVGTKWVANKWFHTGGQEFMRRCSLDSEQ